MKSIAIVFFILTCQISKSQITVVGNLDDNYENAFNLMHPFLQNWVQSIDSINQVSQISNEKAPFYPIYVTNYSVDTLNIDTIKIMDLSGIKINAINGEPHNDNDNTEQDEWNRIKQDIWFENNSLVGDTLLFNIGPWMSYESINLKIFGDNILGKAIVADKYDEIFKLNEADVYTKEISVGIKFEKAYISGNKFSNGDIVYGYVIMNLEPYFVSNYMVINAPLHLKKSYELYFKIIIGQ